MARGKTLYPYGSIVIVADMLDPQGNNPKPRRCIVVTPDSEPRNPAGTLDVVAIAGTFPKPVPADHVLIPHRFPPHPITGCVKECVAVCTWQEEVDLARISPHKVGKKNSRVTAAEMLRIAKILASMIT